MNRKSIYSCLIIGYGNTLRGYDGVGCYLADRMAEQSWSGLRSQSVHQLTPELVVEMAEVQQVIFIDAYPSDIPQIRVEKLSSKSYRQGLDHTGNPQYLLALTEQLYGKQPDAWWVLIPGKNFELSENNVEYSAKSKI